MFTLSYLKAVEIQQSQLQHYGAMLSPEQSAQLHAEIIGATKPCSMPHAEQPTVVINELVPRGCQIETVYLRLKGKTPAEIRAFQASMD